MKTINIITFLLSIVLIQTKAQNFNEITKIVASDRGASDWFGYSTAISGNYAVVGTYKEDEDVSGGNTLTDAGAAYIYERDATGNWNEVQKIVASDRAAGAYFGKNVAISGDYVIIGADQESKDVSGNTSASWAGAAYIFERDANGNWIEVQKIVASDRDPADHFGSSVAISGNYVVIGAYNDEDDVSGSNALSQAGSAYIFERGTNGVWTEIQKIVASDRGGSDWFGNSVAISGNYAIIGAPGEDDDASGGNTLSDAGSSYVFERDTNGVWTETQKIVASDRGGSDWFGSSVAVSGNYAVIGAYKEDDDASGGNTLSDAGSAYVFERDTNGVWTETQKIVASDRGGSDWFARSVSISGNYIIVGAPREDQDTSGGNTLSNAGSSYVFERGTNGVWAEAQKIVASDRDNVDYFGSSVAISGNYAVVGAYYEDEDASGGNTLTEAGSAYVFESCSPSTGIDVQTACDSYTWIDGNTYTTSTNTPTFTLTNASGCDSVVTLNLTINSIDVTTTVTGFTITANNSSASGYQWINCIDNTPINGATGQSFTASQNGSYAVIITDGTCTDTSFCRTITGVGIHENNFTKELTIYPNPTKGNFIIDLGTSYQNIAIEIRDITGKKIPFNILINKPQLRSIDITNADAGVYFVIISTNKNKAIFKLIIDK